MENHIKKGRSIYFGLFISILLLACKGCSYKILESRIIVVKEESIDSSIVFIFPNINGIFDKSQFISYIENIKTHENFDSLLIDSLIKTLNCQGGQDTIIAFGYPQLFALTSSFMINRILSGEGFIQDRITNEFMPRIKYVRFKEIRGESRKEIARLTNDISGEVILEKILSFSHHHKF